LAFASITLEKTNLSNGFIEGNINNKPFGIEIGFTTENVEETVAKAVNEGRTYTHIASKSKQVR